MKIKFVRVSKNSNTGITLVSLVVTIIILIILAGVSLNLTLGDNGLLTLAKRAKENAQLAQIQDQASLNALYEQLEQEGIYGGTSYDAIAEAIEKLAEFKKQIADYIEEAGGIRPEEPIEEAEASQFGESIKGIVNEVTKDATATAGDIAKGKTAWVKGIKLTGSMPNNVAITKTLSASESYTIPAGYHDGKGTVTAKDLASQTQGTATAGDIANGKKAWVNGNLITGTKEEDSNVKYKFVSLYDGNFSSYSATITLDRECNDVYISLMCHVGYSPSFTNCSCEQLATQNYLYYNWNLYHLSNLKDKTTFTYSHTSNGNTTGGGSAAMICY